MNLTSGKPCFITKPQKISVLVAHRQRPFWKPKEIAVALAYISCLTLRSAFPLLGGRGQFLFVCFFSFSLFIYFAACENSNLRMVDWSKLTSKLWSWLKKRLARSQERVFRIPRRASLLQFGFSRERVGEGAASYSGVSNRWKSIIGKAIDQSILIDNLYRPMHDDQPIVTWNLFIDCHRLAKQVAPSFSTRVRRHSNLPLAMADAYKKSLSLKKLDSSLVASLTWLKANTIAVLKWTLASFNITASKKRGERGNAFKVINGRGQLGHLQSRLVDPLWHIFLTYILFDFIFLMQHLFF